jgi:hypothetical protein
MDTNDIGNRGETIFASRISANYDFKVYFMGEKAPIGDFILEINDENTPYECMVQVKGTTQGYNVGDGRLKAKVEPSKLQKLLNRPLPTYVAGVDVDREEVYIAPVFTVAHDYTATIPVGHKLALNDPVASQTTLNALKQDIINFWTHVGVAASKATFNTSL